MHYFLINNVIVTLCWWSFFFFLSNRTNRMNILQKKFTRMAYNWLGILKMALWRLEKPLSPWDWMPQPSEYGTECLEDFWRAAGLPVHIGTQRSWIQMVKKGSSRETDTPTRKKWEQRRSGFLHAPLYIWTISVRKGPFSFINYSPKCPHVPTQAPVSQLITNEIKLAIWTIASPPLWKFTIRNIPLKSYLSSHLHGFVVLS